MLQAIWLKDEEELYLVEPVIEIKANEDLRSISVYNGYFWYTTDDCEAWTGQYPNRFIVKLKEGDID